MYLRMWSKDSNKIIILQKELNNLFPNDSPKLRLDGVFGPKTKTKVMKFQRSNGKLKVDGIVGPKTLAALKTKISNTQLAKPLVTKADVLKTVKPHETKKIKFQNEMQKEFVKTGNPSEWETFVQAIDQAVIPEIKKILLGLQNAETARVLAKTYLQLKAWKFTNSQIKIVFGQLSKLKEAELNKILDIFGKPGGVIGKLFKQVGSIATKMGLIVTFIECLIFAKKGNYAAIFGEIYKFIIGKGVPWGGMIDALQSFVELVVPKSWQLNVLFKILKAANPVGLGAAAVESIAASATAAYHVIVVGRGDMGAAIPRLDKLVKRLKKSPAGVFSDMGDNAGSAAYELSRMSSTEWGVVWSLNWRRFKSLF